jgi:lipoyl(octanoyl) transferase
VFVTALEAWIIAALAELGVKGERRDGRVGIWVARPDKGPGAEDKIAAIGLRLKRWVSLHGMSINVCPDLSHYSGIVPCGIAGHGVTSLADLGTDLGRTYCMEVVDNALLGAFRRLFGAVKTGEAPADACRKVAVSAT